MFNNDSSIIDIRQEKKQKLYSWHWERTRRNKRIKMQQEAQFHCCDILHQWGAQKDWPNVQQITFTTKTINEKNLDGDLVGRIQAGGFTELRK